MVKTTFTVWPLNDQSIKSSLVTKVRFLPVGLILHAAVWLIDGLMQSFMGNFVSSVDSRSYRNNLAPFAKKALTVG